MLTAPIGELLKNEQPEEYNELSFILNKDKLTKFFEWLERKLDPACQKLLEVFN